jgi:hypothetical protein
MPISWPAFGRDLLLVAVYNTAVGLFLTALTRYGFAVNLVYSNCIGTCIYIAVRGPCLITGQRRIEWMHGLIGIPVGFAVGFVLATWLNGFTLASVLEHEPNALLIAGVTAALFGVLGTWHFHDEARVQEALADARAERLRRIEQEALTTHTELALLQAQIEPHFLFNTLSNVVGLIETQPTVARTMLLDLTALLRTSLARTRRSEVTLAEETDLLRAYLGIMAVRMGTRLRWRIEADDTILALHLPPLLVQPLVENAIRHGLEPKPEGGDLVIRCVRVGDMAVVEVEDSGCGLVGTANADSVGLSNVRERLAACYGSAASLTIESNAFGGVTACLHLPWSAHASSDRR